MLYVIIFAIGTIIGSFLNVVICRTPEKKSILKNRSACIHCKSILKAYDLIPIVSFFILKAKCRQCKKKISWQYPLVELFTGAFFVFLAWHHELLNNFANPIFFRDLIFTCALIIVFTTDWRFFLILDAVTIPMMVFALLVNIFLLGRAENFWQIVLSLVVAAIVAGGFFFVQRVMSKGKWVGGGDIRLGLLMGFMLAWPKVLLALFLAYIVGAVVSLIFLAVKKKTMKSQLPFGVFLSVGTFVALIWGEQIIHWYLSLIL